MVYSKCWIVFLNIHKNGEWKLILKYLKFRNGGEISNADKLYYDGKLVETVDKFSYLGFIFLLQ